MRAAEDAPMDDVMAMAKQAHGLVAVSRAMFASGRRVELAGLDGAVGLVCAKAIDLPPGEAWLVREELVRLAAELAELAALLP